MKSLLGCLSLPHIQTVVSALLRDGKILLHSRNVMSPAPTHPKKYQLTLCSTALLALLCPVHYTLTFIPLLPAQLMDYIEVAADTPTHPQAPTPYLIGIYSNTFALHATDLDSVLIAHLDFDKVGPPLPLTHSSPSPRETPPCPFPSLSSTRSLCPRRWTVAPSRRITRRPPVHDRPPQLQGRHLLRLLHHRRTRPPRPAPAAGAQTARLCTARLRRRARRSDVY